MATIQGVYVALFGRPADPAGLAYFNGITNEGKDLSQIASLAGQKEFTDRFAGQTNNQIVNSIYQSLFNRDAESAGLNFFVGELVAGRLNINNVAIAILDSAQNADKTIVTNKIAAADLFTKSLDTPVEIAAYSGAKANAVAASWLAGVTTTAAKQSDVDATITKVIDEGTKGNTIALTANDDTLSTTSGIGTPAVTTTNNNDTVNGIFGGADATWNPATDKVDGGLGVDTFNLTVAAGGASAVAENGLKNIEIINVTTSVAGGHTFTVAEAKQATQVWNNASTANLTVAGIADTTTVGLKGAITGTTAFNYAETAGTNTANVSLNAAVSGTNAVTIAATEIINITNTGTSNVRGLTVDAAQTLNVSGSGALTLGVVNVATLATIDASSFTGALTADVSANNGLKAFTGGSGIDKITADTQHDHNLTINAGAGADIISIYGVRTVTLDAAVPPAVDTVTNNASDKLITLSGGAGQDTFVLGTAAKNVAVGDEGVAAGINNEGSLGNITALADDNNANLLKALVVITDFNKAEDAIKIGDGVATGGGRQSLLDNDLVNISGATDLFAAVGQAAALTAVGKVSIFNFGDDAYLFVNSGTAAFDAGDTLVKVVGATAADFTATNFAVI